MKSVQLQQYSKSFETLQLNNQTPSPVLKPGQLLIENHAASVNPFDIKLASGIYKNMMPIQLPAILGGDFAGVVTQVGEGATIHVGDEVYGSANILSGGSGTFAEVVAANEKNIAQKPTSVSFTDAAAVVLTGVSAIQALEEHIKLQSGQKILIHGGAGGIGSVAIQLAKAIGAHVATTVSTDDKEFVSQLNADEIIDYKTEKFEDKVKEYDAVYDTVGGETAERSVAVLKQGGILVSMLGEVKSDAIKEKGITVIGQNTHVTTAHLNRLSQLLESNQIKPQIEKRLPLDQLSEAFAIVQNIHHRGKVVITIKE